VGREFNERDTFFFKKNLLWINFVKYGCVLQKSWWTKFLIKNTFRGICHECVAFLQIHISKILF
jgi:hypothetical protein